MPTWIFVDSKNISTTHIIEGSIRKSENRSTGINIILKDLETLLGVTAQSIDLINRQAIWLA
jgi:hypothetical protein